MQTVALTIATLGMGFFGGMLGAGSAWFGAPSALVPLGGLFAAAVGFMIAMNTLPAVLWRAIRASVLAAVVVPIFYFALVCGSRMLFRVQIGDDRFGFAAAPLLFLVPILAISSGCLAGMLAGRNCSSG
jgi:hypothetical protein